MAKEAIATVLLMLSLLLQLRGQATVNIEVDEEFQTIHGFGAFGAMKPYWEPSPFYTAQFIDLFIKDLGTTIVRTNIFWDLEPVNDNASPLDTDLSKFSFKSGSELAKQLPYYKALKEAGVDRIIATSWTPPVWMKLHDDPDRIPNECYNCNNCPKGDPARRVCGGRLNPAFYMEYAEYLAAYVKIVKQETGIDIYAISLQNEPFFANPFEANVVYADEYADILSFVAQRFRQEGLQTKLFGPEHMAEWSWGVQQDYVAEILKDLNVHSLLDIYAVHGYVDGVAPDYGSASGWTTLHEQITQAHGKPLWMTETSGYPQTWQGAVDLARSMYLALRFGNISAWVYWSINNNPGNEFSLMSNGEPTDLYAVSKQFFKFIQPGAIRIAATSTDNQVLPLAFKNPFTGAMTVVLINSSDSDKEISLTCDTMPLVFTAYRTSASERCVTLGSTDGAHIELPAKSVTTLTGSGSSGPYIQEIPNYYLHVGEENMLTVPLNGLLVNGEGELTIEAESSDTDVVSDIAIDYSSLEESGALRLHVNTDAPGKATVKVILRNQNELSPGAFGFNSTMVTFKVEVLDAITSVSEKNKELVIIYPNPAQEDKLNIKFSSTDPRTIEVLDVHGKTMLSDTLNAHHKEYLIDTQGWNKGLYIIKIHKKGDIQTRSFVVR